MASTTTWEERPRAMTCRSGTIPRPLKIGWFAILLCGGEPRSCFSASSVSHTDWTR